MGELRAYVTTRIMEVTACTYVTTICPTAKIYFSDGTDCHGPWQEPDSGA